MDALSPGAAGFLGEPGQIAGVAGEQDDRPGLAECHHGQQRIKRASVARQPGAARQFAGRAPLRLVDRGHRHPAEHAM
ncbi:MAG TPA: hypothetical protein VMI33_10060 [Streptosporangiaceae bacterium]|nr:hypothetical protein [Streptosporangiaceae bacterium]